MKDIDFDELDKAVGSVLNGADTSTPSAGDEPKAPLNQVSADTTVSSPASASSDAHKATVIAPARRRGQFLDMVHPSAQMTQHPSLMPSTPRKALSPVAPAVSAVSDDSSSSSPETQPTVESSVPVSVKAPEASETSTPEATPAAPAGWPDPLDITPPAPDKTPEPKEEATSAMPDPLTITQESIGEKEPLATPSPQTPFVSDAQVAKRPLGAFQASEAAADEAKDEEATPATETEKEIPAEPLTPELDSSVVSVEAHEEADEQLSIATEKVETAEVAPVLASATAPVVQSISQQYSTPAPTPISDEAAHPLFGDDYHQPLLPEGHKKSFSKLGLVIVCIVILLAIGAALGYLAYTSL